MYNLVEQWRDGEKIREMILTDEMIQRQEDGSIVITFPPQELAGGLVIATGDELRLSETDDGESQSKR